MCFTVRHFKKIASFKQILFLLENILLEFSQKPLISPSGQTVRTNMTQTHILHQSTHCVL